MPRGDNHQYCDECSDTKYELNSITHNCDLKEEEEIEEEEIKCQDTLFYIDVEVTEDKIHGCGRGRLVKVRNTYIYGWILNFFAMFRKKRFNGNGIKVENFNDLASQIMTVNFDINDKILMKYKVGFIGCDKNEKNEIFPVQGWIVSKIEKEDLL
jgi:hypothetical protein